MNYPANLLLAGKAVLVVGGGPVALGKVRGLLDAEAVVTVVAPEVVDELAALGGITIERRAYRAGEVAAYRLVITATGDPEVGDLVHADAEAAGIWINAADDPARCTFTLPARIRRGDVLVTVSTGGRSPAVAAWLRERLEAELEPELALLVEVVAEERDRLRADGVATEGLNWREALRSGMLEKLREGDLVGAREMLRTCLSSSSD